MTANRLKCALVLFLLLAGTSLFASWSADHVWRGDVELLDALASQWKPAAFGRRAKVLVFSGCYGYNHHGGRCYGDYLFRLAGERTGAWETTSLTNAVRLGDAAYLAQFDAIVLNNSTCVNETNAPGVTAALTGYLASGKGIALIHAGIDAFKDSETLQKTFGGYFQGHPWHDDGTWKFRNEALDHPVNASFRENGGTFRAADEIYQFPRHFDRSTCKVLVSVDLSDPFTKCAETRWIRHYGPGSTRADHDYAVSWIKQVGKGRVFYTSFGHDRAAFLDSQRLFHMLAGIQFALGDMAY